MKYDVVIVGGGIAGLTSSAFLSKVGYKVLVCEKESKVGGLVNSFDYKGFTFDGGIRAIENSGIVLPMLRQLGIEIDFVKNNVSIGIENDIVMLKSKDSLYDYQQLLNKQFPDNINDIQNIIDEIKLIMKYMDILYGINNPVFLDIIKDKEYFAKTIFPWLFKFMFTINKVIKLNTPIEEYLKKFTTNQVLIDMIAQHFFQKTPAFFALSYFSLYLDYMYPIGGTGKLIDKIEQFIIEHNGMISKETEICSVLPQAKRIIDTKGNTIDYDKLIWACDLKKLYSITDIASITDAKTKANVFARKNELADKIGGDSIYTLYLTVDKDKSEFENICSAHFFYTPYKKGLLNVDINKIKNDDGFIYDKQAILVWLEQYYMFTTYEIAFPVLRDAKLAPIGKTGLIISTLLNYSLVKHIYNMGWYEEFKELSNKAIINVLDTTIFPSIKVKVIDNFSSTPLTIESVTGNSEGAITGWAFTNSSMPVVSSIPKVAKSVITPIPDVLQIGQWSYSPSGLPISILTAKLAADRVTKQLKK